MPIGKNSLKRVANNGYSNLKTEAPDMENSNVIENAAPQVMEMVEKNAEKQVKKTEAKKPSSKKPTNKSGVTSASAKKSANKTDVTNAVTAKNNKPEGFIRVAFGEELPFYLL